MPVTPESRETPVKVVCDNPSAKPRFLYVQLDEEDCKKVKDLEHCELDKTTLAGYKVATSRA